MFELTEFQQLTSKEIREINDVCDRFEESWKAFEPGKSIPEFGMAVNSFHAAHPESRAVSRSALCKLLVDLDIRFRRRFGCSWSKEFYLSQLPAELQSVARHISFAPIGRHEDCLETVPVNHDKNGSRYRKIRPFARGGLGEVSVAEDLELHREVALKEIQPKYANDAETRTRFVLEAEVTGNLEHPGIVPIYGLGKTSDGRPYYVMRFIRGASLKEAADRLHNRPQNTLSEHGGSREHTQAKLRPDLSSSGSIEFRKLIGRFVDVCNAIDYAHSRGVLHRDLKPSNVMLGDYGETLVVDWGLAKFNETVLSYPNLDGKVLSDLKTKYDSIGPTQIGSTVGTPAFMSPEQAAGQIDSLGPASDVYGLGATLYYLLTGKPPVEGDEIELVLQRAIAGEIKAPREIFPGIAKPLEAICLKALAKEPSNRYATTRELADDVEAWLADAVVSSYPEPFIPRVKRWIKQHQALAAAAAVLVVTSTMGLAVISSILNGKNSQLSQKNTELIAARDRAQSNEQLARQQSEIALQTMAAVIGDVQKSLRELSGEGNVRQRILTTMLSQLQQLSTEFLSKSSVEMESVDALLNLGEVAIELGLTLNLEDAEPADSESSKQISGLQLADLYLSRAIDIAQSVLRNNPGDTDAMYKLAAAKTYRSYALFRSGKSQAAIATSKECVEIFEQILNQGHDRIKALEGLGMAYTKLGDALLSADNIDEALQAFEKDHQISQELAADKPEDDQIKRSLLISVGKIAQIQLVTGKLDEAHQSIAQCIEIAESLTLGAPNNDMFQRDLGICLTLQGDVFRHQGQLAKAVHSYELSQKIDQLLYDRDPTSHQCQRDLSLTCQKIADVYLLMNQFDRSLELSHRALSLALVLAENDSENMIVKSNLVNSYSSIGNAELNLGRKEAAQSAFQQAVQCNKLLMARDPSNLKSVHEYAKSLSNLGVSFEEFGDLVEAAKAFHECIDSLTVLSKQGNFNSAEEMQITVYQQLAQVYKELGDYSRAVSIDQAALVTLRRIAERNHVDLTALKEQSLLSREIEAIGLLDIALGDMDNLLGQPKKIIPALLLLRAGELMRKQELMEAVATLSQLNQYDSASPLELYAAAQRICNCAERFLQSNENDHDVARKWLDHSVVCLQLAIKNGFDELGFLSTDRKLKLLRGHQAFQELISPSPKQ